MSYTFCNLCKSFSLYSEPGYFIYRNKKEAQDAYQCSSCNKYIPKTSYNCILFGKNIEEVDEDKDQKSKRISTQEQLKIKLNMLNDFQKKKIIDELQCPICFQLVDMTANLRCLNCKHLFCFYCLINSLKTNKNCPCCRSTITIDTLSTSSSLNSTFDLMIEVAKPRDIVCKIHDQRCDLYCRCCKQEILCECILSDQHKSHTFVSLKILHIETNDLCKEQLKLENSIIQKEEIKLEHLNDNKEIYNIVTNELYEPYLQYFQQECAKYKEKLDQNIKRGQENQENIKKFCEYRDQNDLLCAINSLENQKLLANEFKVIINDFEASCSKEELIIFNSVIKECFTINMSEVQTDKEITMKPISEESKICSINLLSDDSNTLEILIKLIEPASTRYYVKFKCTKNSFSMLINPNKFLKIEKDLTEIKVNKLLIDRSKVEKNDKLEFELSFWEITKEVEDYISASKESIKTALKTFIDTF